LRGGEILQRTEELSGGEADSRDDHRFHDPMLTPSAGTRCIVSSRDFGLRWRSLMGPEIIIVPSLFFMVGFVVYVIVDGYRRRQQVKVVTEVHAKLLDRLGSAKEFAEFFTSDAGSRFLESLSSSEGGAPQARILRSMQAGFVLLALGVGFFILLDQRTFSIEAVDG
jgi:hypothetical protein